MDLSVQRGLGANPWERCGTAGNAIADVDGIEPLRSARRGNYDARATQKSR